MASLIQTLFSYLHFYFFSIIPHILGMILYAVTPERIYNRLKFFISILRQSFNVSFGRLLPTLPFPATDLTGKTAIVTGANSGIGYQLALSLAHLNCAVLLAVRSESKGRDAVHSIITTIPSAKGRVKFSLLDTSSPTSIHSFADTWQSQNGGPIDILIHNAGIAHSTHPLTPSGIESLYATNFLGSFLLTHLLEPHLSPDARVIFTSSFGQVTTSFAPDDFSTTAVRGAIEPGFHTRCSTIPVLNWRIYSPSNCGAKYAQTKGMQCAFARILQRRWDLDHSGNPTSDKEDKNVLRKTAHAFTPGFTMTPIFGKVHTTTSFVRDLIGDPIFTLLTVTTFAATHVSQGAMTGLWLASASEEEIAASDTVGREPGGGGYWDRMGREVSVADFMSDKMLERLWKRWQADAEIEWI